MPQCTGSPTSDELNIGVIFQGVTKMAGTTKGPAAAKTVKKKSAKKVVTKAAAKKAPAKKVAKKAVKKAPRKKDAATRGTVKRSEESKSERQSIMRHSYDVM